MLAKELEIRRSRKDSAKAMGSSFREKPLPLDNLDKNILCADALFTEWPKVDAIIGNPPYLGSRYLAKRARLRLREQALRQAFPGVPKMADFCTYWFRLAHDHLAPGGRAGLVGTQKIRSNTYQQGGLDYIVGNGGVITEAVAHKFGAVKQQCMCPSLIG